MPSESYGKVSPEGVGYRKGGRSGDVFHSILPPSPPLIPISHLLWWHFSKTLMWRHLYTYIYSLLLEKDICDRRNNSIKHPCVCVTFARRSLIFSVRVSSSFSHFLYMLEKVYFLYTAYQDTPISHDFCFVPLLLT